MTQTNLPVGLNVGVTGHTDHHNVIHAALNRMTRTTGVLDISGMLVNGWKVNAPSVSAPYAHLIRRDQEVTLRFRGLNGSAATDRHFLLFGASESENGEPRISTALRPAAETNANAAFRSGVLVRPDGELFTVEATSVGVRVASLPNADYQFALDGYELRLDWRAPANWPSFLPPAV